MYPYGVKNFEENQKVKKPQGKRIKKVRQKKRPRQDSRKICNVRNFESFYGQVVDLNEVVLSEYFE